VTRHSFALPLFAVLASLAVVLGACNSTPAAPPLTDPKEILTKAIVTLRDVKTAEFTGSFTGSLNAEQLGNFDLSKITMSGQFDIPNKKVKFSLDAPTLLGTKIDALVVDQVAYYKVAGPAAISLHASADKYTKVPLPSGTTSPVSQVTDVATLTANTQAELDKLPQAPVKQADEKCGDQDCYHVSVAMTAADVRKLSPGNGFDGAIAVDIWTRKSDYRPARIGFSFATIEMGSFGINLDLKYDVNVSVDAPPADQVVTP
jgi:hypothetical protein